MQSDKGPSLNSDTSSLRRDIPIRGESSHAVWGSDAIVSMLRALGSPYVCLNPGASFRGIHDSLVNYLGNECPQIVLVLHEEHAVAIAHGYAKVTGVPLLAIVHSNVGLMHASMAIFDAWCDRVPVVVLGATGAVDAAKRRPWIEWLHTSQDQAALVRHFIKWDAQPASVPAAYEALLRAQQIAGTAPKGPVYICFDTTLQEQKLDAMPALPDPGRYEAPLPSYPAPALVEKAAALLNASKNPVIMMGRVSRDPAEWSERVLLAERLQARVLTDLKVGAAFPTKHPLHAASPGFFLSPESTSVIREADVILSLDWLDLGGTLKQAWGDASVPSKIIQVSVDQYNHNGWGMEHQALPPTDVYLICEPAPAVSMLNSAFSSRASPPVIKQELVEKAAPAATGGEITIGILAQHLRGAIGSQAACLMRLPLGWSGGMWDFDHPLDYLGYDGGGGIGSGPGMAIGSAIALKGTGRLPIAVLGDGDCMMGSNALWTAANAEVPMLIIVANNRSFFNDEVHQERVATDRQRPVENRWIGQRIGNPDPDLAGIARAQGLDGMGPIVTADRLSEVLSEAISLVRQGRPVLVDVHVATGYSPSMASGMTRANDETGQRV